MRNKKVLYGILGSILFIALLVGIFSEEELNAEDQALIMEENIYEANLTESWDEFKKANKISQDSRIEDFAMTIDHKGVIVSVKFKIIDKQGNKFLMTNHESCTTCPHLKKGETSIWKEKANEWPYYSNAIDADEFFVKLQNLNEQKALSEDKLNTLFMIRTRQWSQNIQLPGYYFILENKQLRSLEQPTEKTNYQGHLIQILESNGGNFESNAETKNIIIKGEVE